MSELEGERLFRLKDYAGAVEQYNQLVPLTVQAMGKRALAEFELGLFAEAHSDASHVLSVVASNDSSKPFETLISQCEKRLFEQASKLNHHSSDFITSGLEVFEDGGEAGRGLRSSGRRLLAGELLVIASPLVEVKGMSSKLQALGEMATRLMECKDESVLQCVNDLDDGTEGEGMDVKQVLKRNCFHLDLERFALYHMPSLVNHSCCANVCLVFFGSTLVLRAARDIPPQTPIHIRYFAVDGMLVGDRQQHTAQHWQFTCQCHRCQAERAWDHHHLSKLKIQEQPLCDLFFQSHGNPQELAKAWLQLDDFIGQVEQTKVEDKDYLRANFLAAYQVYRACCEAVGGYSAAVCAQDQVLKVFNKVDPCSFEHLKTLAICDLFRNKQQEIHSIRIGAHQIRYGKEPLLVQHSLEQTQTATLTKSPVEWTLKL
ncbi:hypothetical protein BASA81_006311 [Batrachochytrium salamandrivorans]|nr:hypothetical protein BASA81_006311 [Batrachochytrium salamandrivorans]